MKEPLNLPNGSVRSIIAIVFTTATAWLFVTSQVVPAELLVITTMIDGFYFGGRQTTSPIVPEPDLEGPYIGEAG